MTVSDAALLWVMPIWTLHINAAANSKNSLIKGKKCCASYFRAHRSLFQLVARYFHDERGPKTIRDGVRKTLRSYQFPKENS